MAFSKSSFNFLFRRFLSPKFVLLTLPHLKNKLIEIFLLAQRGLVLFVPASIPGWNQEPHFTVPTQERKKKIVHCAYLSKTLPSQLCKKKTWEMAVGFYSMQLFQANRWDQQTPGGPMSVLMSLVLTPILWLSQRNFANPREDYGLLNCWSLFLFPPLPFNSISDLEQAGKQWSYKLAKLGFEKAGIQILVLPLDSCILWMNLRASLQFLSVTWR